jgi:hypothetical protein
VGKVKLIERLSKIQNELKAPKGQRNTFGNYNYRSCEDILEALKPILLKHGCSIIINDDIVLIGDRFYIKSKVTLYSNEGESLEASAFARESLDKKGNDAAQVTGATSSYARKYALNGMFAIDDTKDADATNEHGKEEIKKEVYGFKEQPKIKEINAKNSATPAQVNALKKKFPMKDEEMKKIFTFWQGWDKLTFEQTKPLFEFRK